MPPEWTHLTTTHNTANPHAVGVPAWTYRPDPTYVPPWWGAGDPPATPWRDDPVMPRVPWGDGGICPTVPTPTFDPDTSREMRDAIRRQRERVAARPFIEATRREASRRRARRARPTKNYQERPMGETERALFQNVLGNPTDPAAKNIYADWLEEHNLERPAHAYRWAAARGRHPHVERGKDPEDDLVLWDRQRGRKAPVQHFHRLPRTVFLALRPPLIRGAHQCDSVAHAFEMLADALWRLQRAASPQESDDDWRTTGPGLPRHRLAVPRPAGAPYRHPNGTER